MRVAKVVVILSGGMDSTTLLYDILSRGFHVDAIGFNYGQKHSKELEYAKKTCTKLRVPYKIVNIDVLNDLAPSALTRKDWKIPEGHYKDDNMKQTVVANRNMVLISLATSYAIGINAEKVYYGAHFGDHDIYPDCRKEFVEAMQKSIVLCDWSNIELEAPYIDKSKGDIVKRGIELKVDYKLTWSCYKGKGLSCGVCGTCVERLEAFKLAGIEDPIEYEK